MQPSDGAPGATYEYQLAPACGPNVNGGDASCNAAFSCPNPGDIRFFVFYRELSPVAGDWQRGGDECLSPNPTAEPVREVDVSPQAAQVFNTLPVYASPILFQPDNGAVVNVPLIVRTQGAPLQGSTSAFGITVDVIATPHWHWDFGDGTSLDTDDPGPTYDGTDPRTSPHHYLAHTYPTKGTRTIRLTTTWTGTYTRSDKSGAFPVAGSVSKTSTRDVPVKEYEGRVTF